VDYRSRACIVNYLLTVSPLREDSPPSVNQGKNDREAARGGKKAALALKNGPIVIGESA